MTRLRRWISRIVAAFFGLGALALLVGFTYEQAGRSHDTSRLPQRIGRAVDVGGRTLNLYCSGEGSPTIILETGGNDSLLGLGGTLYSRAALLQKTIPATLTAYRLC